MLLTLAGVTRFFGGVHAVEEVSLAVAEGTVHGLIGPNGAGKTTLLNIISGLLQPSAGSILIDGKPLTSRPSHRVAALGVARTFQNIRLFAGLSALDNVLIGTHLRRVAPLWQRLLCLPRATAEEREARSAALALLDRVGLVDRALEQAAALSYGEQRRVEIARALALQPRVLLLDEPTAGMNPSEARAIATLIGQVAQQGHAVLLIEHNVPLVMSLCHRVTVLNFGRVIADGTTAQVAQDPAVIAAYLGAPS